jgi:hypothetical protein
VEARLQVSNGSLKSHRAETTIDTLNRTRMSTEADTCREYVVPTLQAADWENVAEIIGKFGGADQLRNAVNQLQSLLYAT